MNDEKIKITRVRRFKWSTWHIFPYLNLYTPENISKPEGFLMFSKGIKIIEAATKGVL